MTNTLTKKIVSAAIAASCTFGSFAEVTHAQTLELVYSAQELQTAQGREAIEQRIKVLARDACRDTPNLAGHQMKRACRKEIIGQFAKKLGTPGRGHESN